MLVLLLGVEMSRSIIAEPAREEARLRIVARGCRGCLAEPPKSIIDANSSSVLGMSTA